MPEDAKKPSRPLRKSYIWILLASLALLAVVKIVSKIDWSTPIPPLTDAELITRRPLVETHNGFAGSDSCRECHQDNHQSWYASWHRTMTQEAKLENILGDFSVTNLSFADTDKEFTLFEREGRAWFRPNYSLNQMHSRNTEREEYPIVMMTGSHHMQVYWYPIGRDRLLALLPIVHLKEANRWIPRKSSFLEAPSSQYHPETGRWNSVCLGCHSTGPMPYGDHNTVFDTKVAELGISCEACHGQGKNHVRIHRNPESPIAQALTDPIVDPAKLDHRLSTQICGACHSVHTVNRDHRNRLYHDPGQELDKYSTLALPPRETMEPIMKENPDEYPRREDLSPDYDEHFWWDGMIRVSGREYNGLIQSACHTEGEMSCLSCHAMHQAASDKRSPKQWANDQLHPDQMGDQACLNCHDTKTYSTTAHTRHLPDSSGSQCYNCHMPYTTYGLLKSIRSHTITSPTIIETLESGRPNACNLCHLDKTLDWTGTHLADWYGHEKQSLDDSQKTISLALLMALEGDAAQRAIIADAMGWPPGVQASQGSNWIPPILSRLLHDPYDAVRYIAGRSLSRYPAFSSLDYDFLAAKSVLTNTAINSHRVWTESRRDRSAHPEVLIMQDGSSDQTRFEEIYARRNDRDITLKE